MIGQWTNNFIVFLFSFSSFLISCGDPQIGGSGSLFVSRSIIVSGIRKRPSGVMKRITIPKNRTTGKLSIAD